MSRFNPTKKTKTVPNFEGAPSFEMTPERELYSLASTTFLGDQFYRSASDVIDRLFHLAERVDIEFLQGLPIYVRTEMQLRSVPLLLLVALARRKGLTRKIVFRTVQRADELTEAMAAWQHLEKVDTIRKAPMALKRGIADALDKFNTFQISKYHRGNHREVTLKNVLEVIRPKPKNELQSKLFKQIVDESLPPAVRWETALTATKGDEELKHAAWEKLILENKLGYMALLRNLRNILQANVSREAMKMVVDKLEDPQEVRHSRQLPFRWLSAYNELKTESPKRLMQALERGVLHAAYNVPGLEELCTGRSILIAADISGSMNNKLSLKSKVTMCQAAMILGKMMYTIADDATFGTFDSEWEVQPHSNDILAQCVLLSWGGATHGHKVIDWAIDNKKQFDMVCMFTDMQLYSIEDQYASRLGRTPRLQSSWKRYTKEISPGCKMYIFDMAGYGHAPINFARPDVIEVAGWSEKIFKYISDVTNRDLEKIIADYAK